MRNYEIMFIVRPTLSEDEIKKVASNFQKTLETNGAKVTSVDAWGQKTLAYEIKLRNNTYKSGYYFVVNIEAGDDKAVKEFDPVVAVRSLKQKALVSALGGIDVLERDLLISAGGNGKACEAQQQAERNQPFDKCTAPLLGIFSGHFAPSFLLAAPNKSERDFARHICGVAALKYSSNRLV